MQKKVEKHCSSRSYWSLYENFFILSGHNIFSKIPNLSDQRNFAVASIFPAL